MKFFLKLQEKDNGDVFWNKRRVEPLGKNGISINNEEDDINPNIQAYFTKTNFTTKHMHDEDKLIVNKTVSNVGFSGKTPEKSLKSTRMKDAFYNLPKAIAKIRNPPLPPVEIIEDASDNLQGEAVKIFNPSNIIDIYTRIEILLGLSLSGHTDTLTEASSLLDEQYNRGEIQNEH